MSNIQDKLKSNRTRPAEIEGEPVNVKVHSGKDWKQLQKNFNKWSEEKFAEFLAEQFTDMDGKPVLTKEFLLSDDCPTCVPSELAEIIVDVNQGFYKKK